jgi:thiol:disulfide interchange protein DsbC
LKTPNPRFRVIPSLLLALVASLLFVGPLAAETKTFVDKAAEQAIRGAFKKARPDLAVSTIATSEIPGLYRVEIQNGPTLYSSADGRYFVAGELFELGENGIVNVAEKRLQPMRKDMLAKISRDDMIIFSPEGETKGALYVFTDVDCGFCQKLHQEVPALNAKGIEVRYLAYPRQGVGTPTFKKMVSAWCADDRLAAMDAMKARKPYPQKQCKTPIIEQYELGQQLGVTGTPAIVTESGMLIPGYRPAEQLIPLALR